MIGFDTDDDPNNGMAHMIFAKIDEKEEVRGIAINKNKGN